MNSCGVGEFAEGGMAQGFLLTILLTLPLGYLVLVTHCSPENSSVPTLCLRSTYKLLVGIFLNFFSEFIKKN